MEFRFSVKLRYFQSTLECGRTQKMAGRRILILSSFFFFIFFFQMFAHNFACARARIHVWPPVGNLLSDLLQWNHKPQNPNANTTEREREKKNGFLLFFPWRILYFSMKRKFRCLLILKASICFDVPDGRLTV